MVLILPLEQEVIDSDHNNNSNNNSNNNNNACTFPNPTFVGHPTAATTHLWHTQPNPTAHRRFVQQSSNRNNYPLTTQSDAPTTST
jgi:hypothetical protein